MFRLSHFGSRSERKNTSEQFPLLHDDELEIREAMPAFGRGCVALDIGIDKNGIPFVFEIQGIDAGVKGIEEGVAVGDISQELKTIAQKWDTLRNRFPNPDWFYWMTRDKRKQAEVIPEENRPRTVSEGNFDSLFEFGKVIVKPPDEARGKGIKVFDRTQIAEAHAYAQKLTESPYRGFVAQAFIETRGAELAPESLQGNAASMRLVVPFKMIRGKVIPVIQKFGYQRVAAESTDVVVNRALGARDVAMSEKEYDLVLPLALQIIKKLSDYGEETPEYKNKLCFAFIERTSRIVSDIRRKYPVFVIDSPDFRNYEKARTDMKFYRFVERELAMTSPAVWQDKRIRRNTRPTIALTPGSADQGFIDLIISEVPRVERKIPFSAIETGSLKQILEDYANKKALPEELRPAA